MNGEDTRWLPSDLERPSLAELLRNGDADAFAGFRDAHIRDVRAYCEQACPPERVDEACDASFVDLLGRLRTGPRAETDLEQLMLKATRSAAAARFEIRSADAACRAVPELLAADRNGELSHTDVLLRSHLAECSTCPGAAERAERAERAYGAGAPAK